ncbi:hypothetical protein CRI69_21020 [Escherichia sp. E4742]|nr:hypothetical protein FEM44_14205 [Escherichia sp. E4742]TGB54925.1 hypothetical protein CRI69_21020 [Escherichia sp. E4742]TLJ07476.1 hypothetical protein FEK62_14205 [Escherichia sp. E4742]
MKSLIAFSSNFCNNWIFVAGSLILLIPAAKALEFNSKMVRFYHSKDATEMMAFLVECYQV